jgi:hypothetical protein
MIFTFLRINSSRRILLYALDKEKAFAELRFRYGAENASEYSLVAYTPVEKFSLTIK